MYSLSTNNFREKRCSQLYYCVIIFENMKLQIDKTISLI